MLRHFVYSAIVEDCLSLMVATEPEDSVFDRFRDNRDLAQLGNTGNLDIKSFLLVLENLVDNMKSGFDPEEMLLKESYLFGHVCRQEIDKIKGLSDDDEEAARYQDAAIFREYYAVNMTWDRGMTKEALVQLGMTRNEAVRQTALLLRAVFKRAIIRTHTFKPGYEDIHTWLIRFYEKQQYYEVNMDRFAEIIVNPDPDKVRTNLTRPVFFNPDDAIIRMVKTVRDEKKISKNDLEEALGEKPSSLYGQALAKACRQAEKYGKSLASRPDYLDFVVSL